MKVRLDNVVRQYIKERDGQKCITCGCHKDSTTSQTLDWSHKISRSNLFLRWDERNSIAQCRQCHNLWSAGINHPLNTAINNMWSQGTAERLEHFARRNPTIKSTLLDDVEYRMKIEKFYKLKLKALKEGTMTPQQAKENIWCELVNLES